MTARKIKTFGFDAVKLSEHSMEDLMELQRQVSDAHRNPMDPEGRFLENGRTTLYLFDKKGLKKLDAIRWAVYYKQQDARRNQA